MYNIKTLNNISKVGLNNFPKDKYKISSDTESPDAILLRSAKMHEYNFEPSLLAIGRAGAGVNNIPVSRCAENGIVVFNTPGANANAVKELVLASLFLSSRRICEAIDWVKTLKGNENVAALCEKGKAQFAGPEILGKTIGVIGLGAIGVKVCNSADGLGMNVIGFDPFLSLENAFHLSQNIKLADNLDELIKDSDYISLHLPCTDDTKNMIDKECIDKMKDGVRIINLARNELVNNADLLKALDCKKIAKYITDFASEDLIDKENVVVFPHLGASTPESEDNCAINVSIEIMDYLENGNIINSVNLPSANLPRSGKPRICVIHKNISNMISGITAVMSKSGCNIDNMINKSRGDVAYSIFDIDCEPPENLHTGISSIEGVIRVRVI